MISIDEELNSNYKNLEKIEKWKLLVYKVEELIEIMNSISYLDSYNNIIVTTDNFKTLLNPQELVLQSILRTLQTIKFCIQHGHLADTYILIRKCRDDLLFYLYLEIKLNDISNDGFKSKLNDGSNDGSKSKLDDKILEWMDNNLNKFNWNELLNILKNSEKIKRIYKKFCLFKYYKEKSFNNYTHGNGIKFYNYDMYIFKDINIGEEANKLVNIIKCIFNDFIFSLLLLNPRIFLSSDYIDNLEEGEILKDDGKYVVAPIIEEYIHNNYSFRMINYLKEVTNLKV